MFILKIIFFLFIFNFNANADCMSKDFAAKYAANIMYYEYFLSSSESPLSQIFDDQYSITINYGGHDETLGGMVDLFLNSDYKFHPKEGFHLFITYGYGEEGYDLTHHTKIFCNGTIEAKTFIEHD